MEDLGGLEDRVWKNEDIFRASHDNSRTLPASRRNKPTTIPFGYDLILLGVHQVDVDD
jgi:hypothetical protein